MNTKRIEWIDVLKCICIFLVMIDHWEGCSQIFIDYINPFFLNGFFFVSGYCYKPASSFKKLFSKKVYQLFIPWLVFSYANIFISRIYSIKEHGDFIHELVMNALQIRALDDRLWFIACLFVCFIPFYFLIKKYEENKSNNVLFFSFIMMLVCTIAKALLKINNFNYIWGNTNLPWHLEYIAEACFYMMLGYLYKDKYEAKFARYEGLLNSIVLSILYTIVFVLLRNINIEYPFSMLVKYFESFIGLFALLFISKSIKANKYILFVGSNTLIYFSIHNKVMTIMEALIKRILPVLYVNIINNVCFSIMFSFVFVFVISLILIIPTIIINKYFPYLVGKDYNHYCKIEI